MRLRRNKKPTNKEFQKAIQELRYQVMATQSQLHSLTEIFSDFLDYTKKKDKFMNSFFVGIFLLFGFIAILFIVNVICHTIRVAGVPSPWTVF